MVLRRATSGEGIFRSDIGFKAIKEYGDYRNKPFDAIIKNDGIPLAKEEFYELLNFLKSLEKYYKRDAFVGAIDELRAKRLWEWENELHKESVKRTSYVKD